MKMLLSLFFFFSLSITFAQNEQSIEQILQQERIEIEQLKLTPSNSITLVPSNFAKNDVAFKQSVDELKGLTILKVYYVYTEYRKSPNFNQRALDRKRFKQLNESFPEIIESPYLEWELIEQTGCQSPEEGETYFHGFVFVHRAVQTEQERLAEIKRLEDYLNNPGEVFVRQKLDIIKEQLNPTSSASSTPTIIPDQEARYAEGSDAMLAHLKKELRTDEIALKRDDQWVKTRIKVDQNGVISDLEFLDEQPERIKNAIESAIFAMPNWEPAYRDSLPVDSELNLEVRVSYSPSVNGMYLINGDRPSLEQSTLEAKPSDLVELYGGSSPEELFVNQAIVYKGLDIMDKTERCALVMDVTGSMTEHVAILKYWIKANQNSLNFTSFTFFNDGDDKPTRKKKIGSTGGVYTTFSLDNVDNLVTETMRRGGGGERPENDLEALLHTQEKDSICDAILLIGDNYSEVRDLKLLTTLNKRVNLLMCSLNGAIRTDYLQIAKNTGGYLVYKGERIELKNIRNGDVLSVGRYQYDYDGKIFIRRETNQSNSRGQNRGGKSGD